MAIRKELIDLKKDIYRRYNMPYVPDEEERSPKIIFRHESIIDRKEREYKELERMQGKQDQDVPGDKSKCFCYNCKKVFPRKEMVCAIKDGNIASKERTIINGILTVDYNHYHRFDVLVCKKCAKEIKFDNYLFLLGKYGFIIPQILLGIIIACALSGYATINTDIIGIVGFIGVVWGVISSMLSNRRRFYIK